MLTVKDLNTAQLLASAVCLRDRRLHQKVQLRPKRRELLSLPGTKKPTSPFEGRLETCHSHVIFILHESMLAAVTGLGSGSVPPSEYLSGEMGANLLIARMLKVLRFGLGAGLSYYKQAKAKLDGYGSLQIDRIGYLIPRMTFSQTDGPLDGIAGT